MGKSRAALDKGITGVLWKLTNQLPAIFIDTLREQRSQLADLDRQIVDIERRLQDSMRQDATCKTVAAIPGVSLRPARLWDTPRRSNQVANSRHGWALFPGKEGRVGKVNCWELAKEEPLISESYLSTAPAVCCFARKKTSEWVAQEKKRRPLNVLTVALANKMARTIWTILAHDRPCENGYPCRHGLRSSLHIHVSNAGANQSRPREAAPSRNDGPVGKAIARCPRTRGPEIGRGNHRHLSCRRRWSVAVTP